VPDRLFLDANILFSAAWSSGGKLRMLWQLADTLLVTSDYAFVEANRNLETEAQRSRLDDLMMNIEICAEIPPTGILFTDVQLPEKDIPILVAAIESRATHLITGDKRHFGFLFGQMVHGVFICTPRAYLQTRNKPI
jgi:uncharacterized protein